MAKCAITKQTAAARSRSVARSRVLFEGGTRAGKGGTAARRTGTLLGLLAVGCGLAAQPVGAAGRQHDAQPRLGSCAAGQLCLWQHARFAGKRRTYELGDVGIESCVPLPHGMSVESYANRTGRPVTLYQSRECQETGEFKTYPSGSWTPAASYRARALKIWER